MKVKTDYVPENCDYLTVGKHYEVTNAYQGTISIGGNIISDDGDTIYIVVDECCHLNDNAWTIVEE